MGSPGVVAITGLGTSIGRGLVERLLARLPELRVVGLDQRRPFRLDGRVRFHRVDLTEPTADNRVAELLVRERVDAVVHAAFRTQPTPDTEFDHELETIGSLHVMNACAAAKVKRLVVASSTMLYGPRPDNPNFLDGAAIRCAGTRTRTRCRTASRWSRCSRAGARAIPTPR